MTELEKMEQKVKDMKKNLEKKVKGKEKDNWFTKVFNRKRLKKPNEVAVIYLRNNGTAEQVILKSDRGQFNFNEKTYHERRDCSYTITKDRIPLAIIPEWSMVPIGTKDWKDTSMQTKFNELQDHLLRGIRYAELVKMGESRGMSTDAKRLIGWGIGIFVAIMVITQYI